ncbi:hypothetical protein H4R18_005448 [Coemansia javaensis]|uniref:SPX domain-containing protein n=1 Tax=Coemansia javaensis TaxID=2761396 RepID=A0A9W8H1W5_9FUNG|nr:hypothetical protein H4R18_005448 [Coemansia javaensis]
MKFGKAIETSARELPEEWQPYVIQYKLLKKNIKQIVCELESTFQRLNIALPADPDEAGGPGPGADKGPETIAYSIEKDSDGVVHPVIRVKVRRQTPPPAQDLAADAAPDGAAGPGGHEETQVTTVRLEADQLFFDQLLEYIGRMHQFGQRYSGAYCANVSHLGVELAAVTSPYKHDYEVWREIFRLYMDAEVWAHSEGDARPMSTSEEGHRRFAKFAQHIETIGLAQRLRDPMSARVLMGFYKLNLDLAHMRLLQEMNDQATRKIIKKHDKRTHLVAKAQFPQLIAIDTATLTRALAQAIHNNLVGVVPQVDDHLCPMCLSIAWKPLRLECRHVFCSRCIVKASRSRIFDCPVCRARGAVYRASVANLDYALLNFLKLYFPREIRERQRDIQQDISDDDSRAVVAAQAQGHHCIVM